MLISKGEKSFILAGIMKSRQFFFDQKWRKEIKHIEFTIIIRTIFFLKNLNNKQIN